ncbi:rhodopsin, G0-coupled [Patella vulgata]|uniref:rhodopsin, G0-coupled n=1 Tax=Patella vulgata TaxID=6465 RepID=UPI0024A7BF6F|nr:rhodopsin, G0-coupled [Patella vulgata]
MKATCATFGNILVLAVILRERKLRTKPHNVLIVNLAIADLGISFFGYPLTTISGFYGRWMFSQLACSVTGFFSFFLSMGSMNTLMCVSVYRYIMVCDSGKQKYLSLANTKYVIVGIWSHALFWTGLPLLGWGGYHLEPFGTSCSLDWANRAYSNITYLLCTIVVCYLIHVIIIGKCYYKIVITTKKLQLWENSSNRNLQTMSDVLWVHRVTTDKQVTIMCFALVATFLIIWTPYAIVCLLYVILPDIPVALTTIPTMFCKAGCLMNPIIYFATNAKFRDVCRHLYCCCFYRKVENGIVPKKVKAYDEVTKDGVYVGRGTLSVIDDPSMF